MDTLWNRPLVKPPHLLPGDRVAIVAPCWGSPSVFPQRYAAGKQQLFEAFDLDLIEMPHVLTDPPYFDYIAYSELGHFFVPWMVRLGLTPVRHLRGFPEGQLATGLHAKDAEGSFADALTIRLREVTRVCAPSARIVFTYQSLDGRGWRALARALGRVGMRPLQAWPMFGDGGAGLHKHANSISWDCVVHCEVHGQPVVPRYDEVTGEAGGAFAASWAERLRSHGLSLSLGDMANLTHAGELLAAVGISSDAPPISRQDGGLTVRSGEPAPPFWAYGTG